MQDIENGADKDEELDGIRNFDDKDRYVFRMCIEQQDPHGVPITGYGPVVELVFFDEDNAVAFLEKQADGLGLRSQRA